MLRLAIVLAGLLLVLAGCGSEEEEGDGDGRSPAAPAPRATQLEVTVWPRGPKGPVRTRSVECPGTPICRKLSPRRFAPVPRDTPCTAIYGGPGVARVTGTLRGEPVDARFSLEDGCQIDRWQRNRALLGPPGNAP
jgi:hypothetical protein